MRNASATSPALFLKTQEIPFDSPLSTNMFMPGKDKPFAATPAAIERFGMKIIDCLHEIQQLARVHNGLDYLQVFIEPESCDMLWFMEDGPGGAITALLSSDR